MRLLDIELTGFIPFEPNGIKVFKYNISDAVQVVLGTNGCGKSKLFEELSPLPANHTMFKDGGGKVITIYNDNKDYILSSKKEKGSWHHSFFDATNNVELNQGGGLRIQQELVKTHFNYTTLVHKVLTGKLEFTELNHKVRKELIIMASKADLSYIIDIADKAHRHHRDIVGAYRHVSNKLANLGVESSSEDHLETLKRAIEQNAAQISMYDRALGMMGEKTHHERVCLDSLDHLIGEQQVAISRLSHFKKMCGNLELEPSVEKSAEARARIQILDEELEKNLKHLEKTEGLKDKVEMLGLDNEGFDPNALLKQKKEELTLYKSQLDNSCNYLEDATPEEIHSDITKITTLVDSEEIPQEVMSSSNYKEIREAHAELTKALDETERMMYSKNKSLDDMKVAMVGALECEKCGHVHKPPGVSLEAIESLKREITRLGVKSVHLKKELSDMASQVEECDIFIKHIRAVDKLSKCSNLVRLCNKHFRDGYKPTIFITNGTEVRHYFNKCFEEAKLRKGIKSYEDDIETIEMVLMGSDFDVTGLEEKVTKMQEEKDKLEKSYLFINDYLSYMEYVTKTQVVIDEMASNYFEVTTNAILSNTASHIEEARSRLLQGQQSLNESLSRAKYNAQIIDSVRQELLDLEVRKKASDKLVKSLDHKTGLLSDVLRSVLENFCGDVNDYIGSIWEHELSVKPYSSKSKLDFKLPLSVKGKITPEIQEGSEGQKDIVNFAIRMCLMDYLDLTNYPIFMDEVGATFDTTHRDNLLRFTVDMINSGKCSQLFIISHYLTEYGAHSNADFVVINDENIVKPNVYNKNVIIE